MNINETLNHMRKLPDTVASETDPTDRARTVGEILAAVAGLEADLKEIRRAAVVELRKDKTLRAIAEDLGLSTTRVDQISKGKRA
ncbi:hypothetical protein HFP72_21055 [Nocardiopsis sp. ARC36]